MFERAGDYLVRGKIDARLIVRLFPALRGKVIGSEEEVDIFQGLRTILEEMDDIDGIGEQSLLFIYPKLTKFSRASGRIPDARRRRYGG